MIWYQTMQRNLQRNTQLPVLALGLLLAAPDAPAGRPLTVDDAGIADFGNCQLESWVETSGGKSAAWAMPACNFTATWGLALDRQLGELTGIGLERYGQHGDSATTSVGWRRAIVPGRLQLDASRGRKSGQPRSDTWSLGPVWTGATLQ